MNGNNWQRASEHLWQCARFEVRFHDDSWYARDALTHRELPQAFLSPAAAMTFCDRHPGGFGETPGVRPKTAVRYVMPPPFVATNVPVSQSRAPMGLRAILRGFLSRWI
jgi:hypothetical protein